MRRIFLLRHAESFFGETTDKQRCLSDRGQAQAITVGAMMAEKSYQPDTVLCSSALRTRQTWAGVNESIKGDYIHFEDALYNAPEETLLNHLIECDDAHQNVLMIAHNPGIHQLAFHLCHSISESHFKSLTMRYAPATLSVIECDIESWGDLSLEMNNLVDLIEA